MNNIAILYICTGAYKIFWKLFYYSFHKRFMRNSNVQYYVFTDATDLEYNDNEDVHLIEIEAEKWPYGTLKRFHYFLMIEDEIRKYDYCFFFNANMLCTENIDETELLPEMNDILVVEHPGFYELCMEKGVKAACHDFTFERDERSNAHIPYGREKVYVFGAINGGKANAYMDMSAELARSIDDDLSRGIIAIYHDESHLNRFIIDHTNYCLKSPAYAYPDGWTLPFEQKIMVMQKDNIINITAIRENGQAELLKRLNCTERWSIKMRQFFETSRQLLKAKNRNLELSYYMMERGLKNVVIYGYRNLGEIVLDELKDSEINIVGIIDNFCPDERIKGYNRISKNYLSRIGEVDAIIVTALPSFYMILRELIDITDIPVYSIEQIIHGMYIRAVSPEKLIENREME